MCQKRFSVHANRWIAPPEDNCISKCLAKNCLTCKVLDNNNCFTSFSTGCMFVFCKSGTFTCKTKFVIYLISCLKCGLQYVGQTMQPLHLRINGHRHSIVKDKLNTFLCKHFNDGSHSYEDLSVQIIDCVDYLQMSEAEARRDLDVKEDYYIRTLNTVFPLGLNDKLLGKGRVSNGSVGEFPHFGLPVRRRKRSHGVRRNGRRRSSLQDGQCDEVVIKLKSLFDNLCFKECYNTLMTLTCSMKRAVYQKMSHDKSVLLPIFSTVLLRGIYTSQQNDVNENRANLFVTFNSHRVDRVNLSSIFCDRRLRRLLPETVQSSYPPKICYKLCNPISLKICNYSKFLSNLSVDEARNIIENKCVCVGKSNFVNSSFGHIFTGDLDVVDDPKLRQLMCKGAKFRIPRHVPWTAVKRDLFASVDDHIVKLSRRFRLPLSCFDVFKKNLLTRISKRISFVKCNNFVNDRRLVSIKDVEDSISFLHKHFVVTTVDKASGNFAIVCKKFYLSVLMNELGVDSTTFRPVGNVTYSPVVESEPAIVERHNNTTIACSSRIVIDDKCKRLPRIFWIPKLHKNPFKFRFIAGARRCTTKNLSVILNKGLSVVRDSFYTYCNAIQMNSGLRYFWSIKSSSEFLEIVDSSSVFSLQVFDFSTLYTNLGQSDVLTHLFQLFDLVFDSSSRKFLCIGWNRSFFSKKVYKGYHCFDLSQFKEAVHFIISEVFVVFGGKVFQQIRGIPMGGNCSPLLADLFLLHCEFVFMKSLVSNKKFGLAKLLSNNTRYIDDLCIFNYKHFESLLPQIYPTDLIAERNGSDNKDVVYLDVHLSVTEECVHASVYHKVEAFPFEVVLFTFPESLLPSRMGYTIFAGQVLRYLRICSHLNYAVAKIKSTCKLFSERGYIVRDMRISMEKLISKHVSLLFKFGLFSSRQLSINCNMV